MTKPHRILLIEDDDLVRDSLAAVLRHEGFVVDEVARAADVLPRFQRRRPDLVISDLNLPDGEGLEVIRRLRERDLNVPVIVITGYGSIESAVTAMKSGVRDYITKPVDDEELLERARRALRSPSKSSVETRDEPVRLVGDHPSMQRVMATVEAVADTRATVLIQGESGTGKTVLARAIHAHSDRSNGPFVEVSCGSLPDPLLESELFGYERGAFTGAMQPRMGKFEVAHSGTIFLDEIANATPALQSKLLRVLQDRVFERLGDNREHKTDARLVLATNADLEQLVHEGSFRQDLYYRINVVSVRLPALRERAADIPALAEHFRAKFAREHARDVAGISGDLMAFLTSHSWPGNVRELENVIERAVVLARCPMLGLEHLPDRYRGESPAETSSGLRPLKEAMEVPEREYILNALRVHGGNRQKTAEALGVNRTTLFNKMRKYDLFDESGAL